MKYAPLLPRLCYIGSSHLHPVLQPVIAEMAAQAKFELIDATFGEALKGARAQLERGTVDVFVTAGANADLLRRHVDVPVATIRITGFDLLRALQKAKTRAVGRHIGVLTFEQVLPELESVKELLRTDIVRHTYRTPTDVHAALATMRQQGVHVVVGSGLVVSAAREMGMDAILAYSEASVRDALENGLELARMARLEAGRYDQLNAVLHSLQEAVLAVDTAHCVSAANPAMQGLLGDTPGGLLGRPLDIVAPELSLRHVLTTGTEQRGQAFRFAQRDWVVNRAPIREHGELVGAALTMYDARRIQEADTALRVQQRGRQQSARHTFDSLIGHSPVFREAVETARRFARTDFTVLIVGESGVGKELFAQAIHNASTRSGRPFVAINCASFPEALLESELFGHEEGAFTGARRGGHRGMFEVAHTGTLFLDEIGDMPLALQTRLLRVLQEREVTRLGSTSPISVNVRVIAATHQPVDALTTERRFRQDLFYRISALRLPIPPLRERKDDIQPLVRARLTDNMRAVGLSWDAGHTAAVLQPHLLAHDWPGNVRELENLLQRITVYLMQFERPEQFTVEGLRRECPELFAKATSLVYEPEVLRERIVRALEECRGNRQAAARLLGISRNTLWRWLRKYQISE